MYECKFSLSTERKENEYRMSWKKVLKAIFDPSPEKNITVWGCYLIKNPLSYDVFEILIGQTNRKVRWEGGLVLHMGENSNEYKILIEANKQGENHKALVLFGKIILKCENLDWSKVAEEKVLWQAVFVWGGFI